MNLRIGVVQLSPKVNTENPNPLAIHFSFLDNIVCQDWPSPSESHSGARAMQKVRGRSLALRWLLDTGHCQDRAKLTGPTVLSGNGVHRCVCAMRAPPTVGPPPQYRAFPDHLLTGYVFENAAAVLPYLELPKTGATSLFCAELAKKLGCYVIAGYPEKLNNDELDEIKRATTEPRRTEAGTEIEQVGANSSVLCAPDGSWVGGYRKTHLYKTDLTWAKPGELNRFQLGCSTAYLARSRRGWFCDV